MNQELEHAPKGSLKIIERKGRQYYYHQYYDKEKCQYTKHYINDSLSEARKNLIHTVRISAREQLRRWNNDCYEPYLEYQKDLIFETDHGEKVRSKSELIIANILFQNKDHLLYKYEKPIELVKQRGYKITSGTEIISFFYIHKKDFVLK